jgi:hypothetical protein
MKGERKELAVGTSEQDAIVNLVGAGIGFDPAKVEVLFDPETRLYSIFRKCRPRDRTCKRAITREARQPYSNGYGKDRRPVVVTLLPRELIEVRLKGTRRRFTISWDDLFAYLLRRHALAIMRAKQSERTARRKARRKPRRDRLGFPQR